MSSTSDRALQQLLDRAEIVALNDTFARSLDGGTLDMFMSIFTEDIEYRNGERHLFGHGELARFFAERANRGRVSRNIYSGLVITFTGPGEAEGFATWLTFAGSGKLPIDQTIPYLVSDIVDVYRRTDAGWRIAWRTITPIFRNSRIPPPVPVKA